ncbi:methylated-DNA--[protein]-cysteine S-methyltransferase [Arthrobacter agilis]|uniref:methylated-DNA--[protein]-cysteine S-methyltransferase n=1 Tax=Arthrobacter agilis TaxID=37921 RepID=UPI001FCA129D|nr:methylated-DNA--[protein]-cysteine S-methyltransferase [Arthrobacter agilis]
MTTIDQHFEEERFFVELPSPVGPLRVVAHRSAVVGVYHGEHHPPPSPLLLGRAVREQVGTPEGARQAVVPPGGPFPPAATADLLGTAARELGEYFDGSRLVFEVPTSLRGTPFQLSVWGALARIPYGGRRSYRDIAEQLGNPRMGRAIGAAVRANPLSIIVPGHRVVGSTGSVVGYAAGPEAKTTLLELEKIVSCGLPLQG